MRRSKLEMYVDILKVLAHTGPLKPTRIMYKANVSFSLLRECLDFLVKQGMVEEKIIRSSGKIYSITQQGVRVLKYFREFIEILPII